MHSLLRRYWAGRTPRERATLLLTLCLQAVGLSALTAYVLGLGDVAGADVLVANTFATPTNVMRRVARRFVNQCAFSAQIQRSLDSEFRKGGVKQGDTVKVRLPQRYTVGLGARMTPTPIQDRTVDVAITDQTNIGVEFDSWHETLFVQDYMERYGEPAVDQLVNNVDDTGMLRTYRRTAKVVGTPGTVPGSSGNLPQAANQTYSDAVTKLLNVAIPMPFCAVLNPNMHGYLVNANATLFHPVANISVNFRNGQFAAKALGIDKWTMDQNVVTHTVGALGGTPLINGASQTGTSLTGDGATASVTDYFLEGDVIQLASVYDVNPLNRRSTTDLADFVVTSNVASDGSGNLTIPISPSIITAGNFQTVSVAPADDDAITTFGHASSHAGVQTPQGMVFNKDFAVLAMADLVLPGGLWIAERVRNAKLGISIRMLKGSDVINDVHPARFDTAHGWAVTRQEMACRVSS